MGDESFVPVLIYWELNKDPKAAEKQVQLQVWQNNFLLHILYQNGPKWSNLITHSHSILPSPSFCTRQIYDHA